MANGAVTGTGAPWDADSLRASTARRFSARRSAFVIVRLPVAVGVTAPLPAGADSGRSLRTESIAAGCVGDGGDGEEGAVGIALALRTLE